MFQCVCAPLKCYMKTCVHESIFLESKMKKNIFVGMVVVKTKRKFIHSTKNVCVCKYV